MKKLLLLLFISSFFIQQSQSQDFSIVGTWKQVSFKLIKNGKSISKVTNIGNGEQLKAWSKENFLSVGKVLNNNNVNYSYSNGNYILHGHQYTENIKVHVTPGYEGTSLKFYIELKGDTLTQIFSVKNDWSYDKENCWIEKYIKVD